MNTRAKHIRQSIVQIAHESGHGHIPTCFSVVEMLLAVYQTMRHYPAQPESSERDIFILSKGHAALGLYCTLAEMGYFPVDDVRSFGRFQSQFGCHADRLRVPGVEASTGSLGHGIGLAVGMALAFRIARSERRAYCLIGDGESNEGSVWEALAAATHLELTNLTVLYDGNGSQVRCQPIPNPAERFAAFGCDTVTVPGHDIEALEAALKKPQDGVRAIVADTVKGYGCRTLIDEMFAWHRRSPNDDELKMLMEELDEGAV